MSDRMTIIESVTLVRQWIMVTMINFLAWMPDVDDVLKWVGVFTAIGALIVTIISSPVLSLPAPPRPARGLRPEPRKI